MADNYYDLYEPVNNYKRLLFRAGKGLQSRELNEMQLILSDEIANVARANYAEGSIISGGKSSFLNGVFSIEECVIFAYGYTHHVPAASFNIGADETLDIGIQLTTRIITELEDPNLRDPAVNTKNYNQPGAHRQQMTARWVRNASGNTTLLVRKFVISLTGTLSQNDEFQFNIDNKVVSSQALGSSPNVISLAASLNQNKGDVNVDFSTDNSTLIATYVSSGELSGITAFIQTKVAGTSVGSNQPESVTATINSLTDETVTNDFYSVHKFEEGSLAVKSTATTSSTEGNTIDSRLAKYDYAANGSYVVEGLIPTFLRNDTLADEHVVSISEGSAHVEGYEVEFPFAKQLRVPFAKDTLAINNEPVVFQGPGYYPLRWAPLASIGEVNGQRVVTRTITHGNYTGTRDLLPNNPVISVISVVQGGTTYVEGTDFILRGDYIDWSPIGALEPAPGSTYSVTYVYQSTTSTVFDTERKRIYLTDFQIGSTVSVDYTFYIPRIDVLVLDRTGELQLLKGTPRQVNPVPPKVTSGLQLATFSLLFNYTPAITSDYYRAFKMSDIQGLMDRIATAEYNITQLSLRDSLNTTTPGLTKKNIFTDPFLDPSLRDIGIAQNAYTYDGYLQANILGQDLQVVASDKAIQLPFTETTSLDQPYHSKFVQVNAYERTVPPPGTVTISPLSTTFTSRTEYVTVEESETINNVVNGHNRSETWKRHPNGDWSVWQAVTGGSWEAQTVIDNGETMNTTVTKSSSTLSALSSSSNDDPIPTTTEVTIKDAGTFNSNESVKIYFDNVLVKTVNANSNGRVVNEKFNVPANVPAGSKLIRLEGVSSGVTALETFTAVPQIKTITTRSLTTTVNTRVVGALTINWTDPVAQTFRPIADQVITSIDLGFGNTTNAFVDVLVCETLNGYPNTGKTLGATRLTGPQIRSLTNGLVRATFNTPVFVKANEEYAIVIMTQDVNLTVAVAELGAYDTAYKRWLTSNTYLQGVFFNSSNATAWTPLQNTDLLFKINTANYSSATTRTLATVEVDDVTDLMLNASTDVFPGTSLSMTATLLDRNSEQHIVVPGASTSVRNYSGRVRFDAVLSTSNNRVSPIIGPDLTVSVGRVQFPATYVNTPFPFNGSKLRAMLDVYEPSGSTVRVYYKTVEQNLTPAGFNYWAPSINSVGSYYYVGDKLDGYEPAVVVVASTNVNRVYAGSELANGTYFWGDLDNLGDDVLYIHQNVRVLKNTWTQSSVATEFYYEDPSIINPGRVKIGQTELTRGTLGSLGPGQFAFGDQDNLPSDRLYVRMPASEVINNVTNPTTYGQNDQIMVSNDPDGTDDYIMASQWNVMNRISTVPLDEMFVEATFETPDGAALSSSQMRIVLDTTDVLLRPAARNLRAYVADSSVIDYQTIQTLQDQVQAILDTGTGGAAVDYDGGTY